MCTVTFLPINNQEFILTSNRDEGIDRPAALPVAAYSMGDQTIYFPKDPKGSGSWIAQAENGFTLCLLNGAFKPHLRRADYRQSRGLVVLDFYKYNDPEKFAAEYNFEGIEPFTLIMIHASDKENISLHELRWDEAKPALKRYDASLPAIWSSVSLYTPEVISLRENWFAGWLEKNPVYTTEAILFFHHFAGSGTTYNDVIMNRGFVKTVSISCIHRSTSSTEFIYEDLLTKDLSRKEIIPHN